MKKIDAFTNRYSLSKTLRFSLIPVGETEENFNAKQLLEKDQQLADNYIKVKGFIDDYHRCLIERVLSSCRLDCINEYAALYYKTNKSDTELEKAEKLEAALRKSISKSLTSDSYYKKMFEKEMIREILPEFVKSKNEIEAVNAFYSFTTYFSGFYENRKNIYSAEEKPNTIAYRCINENLPRFLDNAKNFEKISAAIPDEIAKLNSDFTGICGADAADIFDIDYFSFVLSQSGINNYNNIIGGYTNSDGTKVQGVNEYINLYNQTVTERNKRLPLMKPLYKQILTHSNTISFIGEKFADDTALIKAVNDFYTNTSGAFSAVKKLFENFSEYDINGIFISNGAALTNLSNAVFESWSAVKEGWIREYTSNHPLKNGKSEEKYYEAVKKAYNKNKSFSLSEIQRLADSSLQNTSHISVTEHYKNAINEKINNITTAYENAKVLLTAEYESNQKLCKSDAEIELIKNLLDGIKELEHILKGLLGSGKEENKDDIFYGQLLPLYDSVSAIDKLYDMVRNHITQKPYSSEKIKLNFENSKLMAGWDKNKEPDCRCVILRKNKSYYLAVIDKNSKMDFSDYQSNDSEDCYEKIEYKLLPGPNKMLPKVFFATANIDNFAPSEEILEIREKESFKKGKNFSLSDCHKLIDFYKASIDKHTDWRKFEFEFSPTEKYNDISEFYNEVKKQGYMIHFRKISCKSINELVKAGKLYLFQIYNKDFSEHSRGNKNLHTRYFEMLFDERNLANIVYQLNGGAEMFYRKASINDNEKIVHPANEPIPQKKLSNQGKFSRYHYDIIKDQRFTKRQFSLHIPITLNYKADDKKYLNTDIRLALKNSENNCIIGIDRGERNLIYVCVINENGEIIKQKSFNVISDNGDSVDYHRLLEAKEKERDRARKSWNTVENIKELKEGYLSQVIHEICSMVVDYDAIIAMENLNHGFKNSRFKVEKQVYQKFENMLAEKLKFLVNKNADPTQNGGLLNAYQLTNRDGNTKATQNGIIFYVPPWCTSKIDPKTGFVNLLNTKYESIAASKSFFERFDNISYNADEDIFEFDIDYSKFERCSAAHRKKWKVCSNGERIITFRNPEKNNAWDNKVICLTEEFKRLFDQYAVDYKNDLKANILRQADKKFFVALLKNLSYTLQMRNSITGEAVDYIISPIRASDGQFFDSRASAATLPQDADANGAYNIARKALWAVKSFKAADADKIDTVKLSISQSEWLEFAQNE